MSEFSTFPRSLRERAERFFASPLADVQVAIDSEVVGLGAHAVACGRRIRLAPWVADPQRPEHLPVLLHELAHVVQQAEGRVSASRVLRDLPVNDDPVLEAEADDLARRFLAGGPPRRPETIGGPAAAVLQRIVTIDGNYLPGVESLGVRERQVLRLIDQGESWLEWAISAPGQPYEFATTEDLVTGIQSGLHGSPLALLPRLALLVSPAKLLNLTEGDLRKIASWENGEQIPSMEALVRGILHRNALWSEPDLTAGVQFLGDAEVASLPLFQVLNLLDKLALLEMLNEPDSPFSRESSFATEAARFAANIATTPREFVDFLQFYLTTIEKLGAKNLGKERREARALAILEEVRPFLCGLVRCLKLTGAVSLQSVAGVLRSVIAERHAIGFDRISSALNIVYQGSELRQQSGEEAARIVERYMATVHRLLLEAEPIGEVLLQDGRTRLFRVSTTENQTAVLRLDDAGDLTLESCRMGLRRPTKESET